MASKNSKTKVAESPTGYRNRIIDYGVKPADQFLANPKNARVHPQFQRDVMKAALEEVGFVAPVIESKSGVLLDGHERIWQALQRDNAPVPFVVVDVDEAEEDYVLATFDPITSLANYDAKLLDDLLRDVNSDQPAIQKMLAELAENSGLYGDEGSGADDPGAQIDRAAELQEQWQVKRGDLWIIPSKSGKGEHRLLCGDSTNADDVARVMGGERAKVAVTDPPYGVNYDPSWRGEDLNQTVHGGVIQGDDGFDWIRAFEFMPTDVIYVWLASYWLAKVQFGIEAFGFITRYLIVWNKDLAVFGRGHYHWKHEPCLYMIRDGCTANWQGARDESTVWDIPTIHSFKNGHNSEEWGLIGHGNQKPIECMARPIRNNSAPNEIVFDAFCGSGTTIVACEQLGRQARAIEIEPKYVAVTLQRLTDMGLTPEL